MGYGLNVSCKCQNKELMLGVGLGFPMVYEETMDDIKSGKYGKEMKDLVNSTELVAVDATSEIYFCEKCGDVECLQPLDLYAPKDAEKIKKRIVGRWSAAEPQHNETIEELGELPYWTPRDDVENGDYVLLKEYIHVCPKCGGIMKKITEEELEKKKCPKCKERYEISAGCLWD